MKKLLKILGIGVGMLIILAAGRVSLQHAHAQAVINPPQDTNNADLGAVEDPNNPNGNVPTTFSPSQIETIGTDGNQIGVYVENTGIAPWYDDQEYVTSISGDCKTLVATGPGYQLCPDHADPAGSSCTVDFGSYSSIIQLHTDYNNPPQFLDPNNPINYIQTSTYTCDLPSPPIPCNPNFVSCPAYGGTQSFNTEVDPGQTVFFPLTFVAAPSTAGIYHDFFQMSSGIANAIAQYGPSGDDLNDFGSTIPITIIVGGGAPPASTVSSVNVTCSPSVIDVTQTSQCTAIVNGTGGPNQAVTWSTTSGAITPSGVFTPSAPGTVTITATSVQDPTIAGTAPITVNAVPTGTVSVVSVDSQLLTYPVPASWDFPANPSIPPATCLTSSTYAGQPADTIYSIVPIAPCVSLFTFNSIRAVPIAIHSSKSLGSQLLSFAKNMFASTADAVTVSPAPSLYLPTSTPTINFTILWNPVAGIGLSQGSIFPSAVAGGSPVNTTITVTNTGSLGSTLTWTATTSTSWLGVSPSADPVGLNSVTGSGSETITISADPSGLSAGTYTGTINFVGASSPGFAPPGSITGSITVTFMVTPSGGPGGGPSGPPAPPAPPTCGGGACPAPSCTFSATPSTVVVPEQASLNYNCNNVTSCSITGGNISSPINFSATTSTPMISGTTKVSPTTNSTYTISCSGPGGSTSQSATVGVSNSNLCESNPGGVNCPTGH